MSLTHFVKDHEQPTQRTVQNYGYIRVSGYIYICLNIKPKLQSKGKGSYICIYHMLYELFLPSINFTSPKIFNPKQRRRSWYIMGTKSS